MGYEVAEFQDTPNPNALKCVLASPLPPRAGDSSLRSYQSPDAATADPLAQAIFTIPGVAGVLLQTDWITITRQPGTDWKQVKAGLKRVLGAAD